MKTTLHELRALVREVILEALDDNQDDFNDAVEELMKQPEMKSLEAFAEFKFDNEEESYGTVELQALARNLFLQDSKDIKKGQVATAPSQYREKVKTELSAYGLKFTPRDKIKQVRGVTSPLNGSNRFAGNHGGSGFENAFNRTPSAGRTFDANDKGALGMGSKKR